MDLVRAVPSNSASPVAVSTYGNDPDRTPAGSPSLLHELMGLSPGGFSETVRHSISSLASPRDRRLGRDASPLSKKSLSLEEAEPVKECTKSQTAKKRFHLLTLPPEIHLLILQRLDFADIERLRRTCKQLRLLASPQQIRALMGPMQLQMQLLGHCKTCLVYDRSRSTLLLSTPADPGYPLASRCVKCALTSDYPRLPVGTKIHLANFETVWICPWCGWPVGESAAFGNEQFHTKCYKSYNDALLLFFILGWIQLSLGVTGAALAWRYFRNAALVFAPTVTSFLLLWVCLGFLVFRGGKRTYHWTLLLELVILGLWVPPVYFLGNVVVDSRGKGVTVPKSEVAVLTIFTLNIIFRLINVLGNLVLLLRYDMTRRYRPNARLWRKIFHPIASWLVFWTYPQGLDHKFTPDSR